MPVDPIKNAQVLQSISRQDQSRPWLTGQTDDSGRFSFTPRCDPTLGSWKVVVRQAGHGEVIRIPYCPRAEEAAATVSSHPPAPITFNAAL